MLLCAPRSDVVTSCIVSGGKIGIVSTRYNVSYHVGLLRYSLRLIQMMLHAIISRYTSAARMLGQRHHLCRHRRWVIMWKRSRARVSQREQRWAWRRKVLELCRELIIWSRLCRYLSTSTPVHKSDVPHSLCVHGTTTALKNKSIPLPFCHHKIREILKIFKYVSEPRVLGQARKALFFVWKWLTIEK